MARLDREERHILGAFRNGKLRATASAGRAKARLQRAAVARLRKEERINIRLSREDLEGLRLRAADEGLPYQTLISSLLHKFVAGRLTERHTH